MNLSKLKPTEWLIVAGGALVLVFGLLKWFSWESGSSGDVIKGKSNAFDYLLTGVLPWLLVVGAAVVTVLLAGGTLRREGVPWPLAILGATLLSTVLIVIRLIIGHSVDTEGDVDVDVSRGIGLWLSAVGSIIATVGAFLTYQANAFDSRITTTGSGAGGARRDAAGTGLARPEADRPPPTPPTPAAPAPSGVWASGAVPRG